VTKKGSDVTGSSVESGVRAAGGPPSFLSAGNGRRVWTERIAEGALLLATLFSASIVILVLVFVVKEAAPAVAHNGLSLITTGGWDNQLRHAFNDGTWTFGLNELIAGTAWTTVGALLLTLVIGLGAAIALVEYAPERVSRPIESVIRLLAGLPSVVFGLVGIMALAPIIQTVFITDQLQLDYPFISTGQCLLTAIIVLTFMIMPFFVSVAVDTLRAVPQAYRLAGHALGLPKWRVATRLVLPSASAGILAGLVLAAARGVGEAIAMVMVAGSTAHIPILSNGVLALLEPVRTLAGGIVENGDAGSSPQVVAAMYAAASLILATSVTLSIASRVVTIGFQKRMRLVTGRTS
jgi:ABC-type phosphate transport system permease subunit